MKIRIYSDLHLEFGPFDPPTQPGDEDSVLILAGDIHTKSRTLDAIRDWAPRFRAIVLVLGNHDYWGGSLTRTLPKYKRLLKEAQSGGELSNVYLLERESVVVGTLGIIGSTLWTDFKDEAGNLNMPEVAKVEFQMNDFRKIRTGPIGSPYQYKLRANHLAAEHEHARAFIGKAVGECRSNNLKPLVVTHHVPSFNLLHSYRRDETANVAYASRALDGLPQSVCPDIWVFGHQHETALTMHRGVVCASNPRGYAGSFINPYFDEAGLELETDDLAALIPTLPQAGDGLILSEQMEEKLLSEDLR